MEKNPALPPRSSTVLPGEAGREMRCDEIPARLVTGALVAIRGMPWRSLHRVVQLLVVGLDLTDVLSTDPTIREEIVFVF